MSTIMSVDRWLKYTDGGALSMRSGRLKAVDAALTSYHRSNSPADKDRLRSALVAWMQEDSGWKTGVRNKYHAVDDLFSQVMELPGVAKSGAGMIALSHLQNESAALMEDLFRNRKLEWRPGYFSSLGDRKRPTAFTTARVAMDVNTLAGKVPSQAAADAANRVLGALVPAEVAPEVGWALRHMMPGFMGELTASVTPFLGVAVSGGILLKDLATVAFDEYHLNRTKMHAKRIPMVNQPERAVAALVEILDRETTTATADAWASGTAFTSKLTTMLVDGGTATNAAIGLAAGLTKLVNTVRVVVRDVLEMKAANVKMQRGIDITIFETCPVVGAYYVCCAPTSVLVNQIFERWWQGGWTGEVERSVANHIEPVRERGRSVIKSHRFVIPALQSYPGVMTVNKDKLEAMRKRVGKSGMVGFGSDDMP